MNAEADHLATSSQNIFRELPELPPPTFYMNDFPFHNSTDGWIETNIPHLEIVAGYRTRTGYACGYARVPVRVWILQPATFKTSPKTAKTVEK